MWCSLGHGMILKPMLDHLCSNVLYIKIEYTPSLFKNLFFIVVYLTWAENVTFLYIVTFVLQYTIFPHLSPAHHISPPTSLTRPPSIFFMIRTQIQTSDKQALVISHFAARYDAHCGVGWMAGFEPCKKYRLTISWHTPFNVMVLPWLSINFCKMA